MSKAMNILYAEDDRNQAEVLMLSVKRYDKAGAFRVDVAETVSEAIGKIDQRAYDAALLDWNLADGYGAEVAQHIRRSDNRLPIVFFSGAWTDDQLSTAKAFSPAGCLEKGYSRSDFEKLSTLIGAPSMQNGGPGAAS